MNKQNHALSFGISRMESIYEKRKGAQDEPHRHRFYTVLMVLKGKGEHIIDFNTYSLANQQLFFIHPGQVHQVIEFEKSSGYSIVFSEEFLIQNAISDTFIKHLNLFREYGDSPPLRINQDEVSQLKGYAEEMLALYQSSISFQYEAIGSLLKLFLIRCNNLECNRKKPEPQSNGSDLLENYKSLLDANFHHWHNVSEYANALHVSPDHLNRVIKTLTGVKAKEHIQSRLSVEAKRRLYFTEKSSKELAFELGFSDSSNFSAFFKKCVGKSPSAFRLETKRK